MNMFNKNSSHVRDAVLDMHYFCQVWRFENRSLYEYTEVCNCIITASQSCFVRQYLQQLQTVSLQAVAVIASSRKTVCHLTCKCSIGVTLSICSNIISQVCHFVPGNRTVYEICSIECDHIPHYIRNFASCVLFLCNKILHNDFVYSQQRRCFVQFVVKQQ